MSKRIWKFPLVIADEQTVRMPVEVCKGEERLFVESVKRCERIGNLDGSALDAGGQAACLQIRTRILSLNEQPPEATQ